jgi:hypothetical protein
MILNKIDLEEAGEFKEIRSNPLELIIDRVLHLIVNKKRQMQSAGVVFGENKK